MSEWRKTAGLGLIWFGIGLPFVGFVIYAGLCINPCGQGGMGTCFVGSVKCDLQPGTGALVALVAATFLILFGMLLRSEPGT